MDENIIIGIEIDRSKGLAQVAQFTAEAEKGKGITIPVKIANQGWGKALEKESQGAGAALTDLANRSRAADNALLNMSRVVQDMPYGFMGIQNNLNPMLESFQRLKAESGSTGSAMKGLIGSLVGGGGLGLALAVVGSAITFATIGLQMWGRSAGEAAEKADEAAERMKSLNDHTKELQNIQDRTNESTGQQIGKLHALMATLESTRASTDARTDAIKTLEKTYPSYFKNLDDEDIKNGKIAATIKNVLIPAIIAGGKARAIAAKIDKLSADNLDLQGLYDKSKDFKDQMLKIRGLTQANIFKYNIPKSALAPLTKKQDTDMAAYSRMMKANNNEIDRLAESYKETIAKAGNIIDGKDVKAGGAAGGSGTKAAKSKIAAVKDEFAELIKKLDEAAAHRFWELMGQRVSGGGLFESLKQWRDVLPKDTEWGKLNTELFSLKEIKAEVPVGITNYIKGVQTGINAAKKTVEDQAKALNDIIKTAMVDGLAEVGAGIGDALSGVAGLGGIFNRVGMVIGNAMIAFGKQLITGAIAIMAAKKTLAALFSNPYAAIAAGVGLIAVGTAIKNSLAKKANQKVSGFADGGAAYGPMLAWVGESHRTSRSNPELFARFDQFKKLVGGEIAAAFNNKRYDFAPAQNTAVLAGDVRFQIEGDRLVGVLARAQGRQNRSY